MQASYLLRRALWESWAAARLLRLDSCHPLKPWEGSYKEDRRWLLRPPVLTPPTLSLLEERNGRQRCQRPSNGPCSPCSKEQSQPRITERGSRTQKDASWMLTLSAPVRPRKYLTLWLHRWAPSSAQGMDGPGKVWKPRQEDREMSNSNVLKWPPCMCALFQEH